jgi:hypothetical protein
VGGVRSRRHPLGAGQHEHYLVDVLRGDCHAGWRNVLAVGAGTGITVAADTVAVDTSVVARHVSATVGDGASTNFTITHNLGNKYPAVMAWNISTGEAEDVGITAVDTNSLTVGFAVAPATNSYLVSLVG